MKHDPTLISKTSPSGTPYSRQSARWALYVRLFMGDLLGFLIGFSAASNLRDSEWMSPNGIDLLFVAVPIYLVAAVNGRAFAREVLIDYAESSRRAIVSLVQCFLILMTILFVLQSAEEISRLAFGLAFAATLASILLFRLLSTVWVHRALGGKLEDELVIVDGVSPPALGGRIAIDAAINDLEPDLNDPAMLERFSRLSAYYDRVIVACPLERQSTWSAVLKTVDLQGELLVERRDDLGVIALDSFAGNTTLVVSRGTLPLVDRIKKRLFDLAIAVPALIFLAPLLIVVAIAIKLDSRGPVFFRQPRVGRNNVPFEIIKFRSMREEAGDRAGTRSTGRDDDRISRVGALIRRTSIDELPQLLNVIKGDMSIVGPRPHALGSTAEDRLFWEITHRYWQRHVLKPGITGLAQVRGYRGATETTSDLTNRLNSDLEYLAGWRLWRDFAILIATLRVLIHPNAY